MYTAKLFSGRGAIEVLYEGYNGTIAMSIALANSKRGETCVTANGGIVAMFSEGKEL